MMSATQLSNWGRLLLSDVVVPESLVITGFVLSVKVGDVPKNIAAGGPVTWLSATCLEAIL